jgi:hypothetical protein
MRLVVCGTDTDVGKTVVSALLVQGLGATYWKPVQSGMEGGGDTGRVQQLLGLPPATAENGSTPLEPMARTALVLQFCSWSAWRMNSTSSALTNTGLASYLGSDMRATMERKFSV